MEPLRTLGEAFKTRCRGLEDGKVLGTIHIALDDNTFYVGGHTKGKIHLDGVLCNQQLRRMGAF